ncbi:MAG: isoprenylcysteine carboxylmethyltransferase family protein [Planctomycetota bacterium]
MIRIRFPIRVARSTSVGWDITKSLIQSALLWGVFLFLVPWLIATGERSLGWPEIPLAAEWGWVIGAVLFLVASSLGISSMMFMAVRGAGTPLPLDTAAKLVTDGPYAYVRNPMAIGGICQALGVGVWLGSPLAVLYALSGALVWNTVLRPGEEADLAARFEARYEAYRLAVRCWIPRLSPYRESGGSPGAKPQRTTRG